MKMLCIARKRDGSADFDKFYTIFIASHLTSCGNKVYNIRCVCGGFLRALQRVLCC